MDGMECIIMEAGTEYVTPGGDVGGLTSTVDPREAWDEMSIDEQFGAGMKVHKMLPHSGNNSNALEKQGGRQGQTCN